MTNSHFSCSRIIPLYLLFSLHISNGFTATSSRAFRPTNYLSMTSDFSSGNDGGDLVQSSSSGGKISSSLAEVFEGLSEEDRYDAVLTGLCARILDNENEVNTTSIEDPIQLLDEMNGRNVMASPRGIMALIDVIAKVEDPGAMSEVLNKCISNGAIQSYGSMQPDVNFLGTPQPTQSKKKNFWNFGGSSQEESNQDEPDSLSPVYTLDDRDTEISGALATSTVIFIFLFSNFFHKNDWSEVTLGSDVLVFGGLVFGVLDAVDGLVPSQLVNAIDSLKKDNDNIKVPSVSSILGVEKGYISSTVLKGYKRLLSQSLERECQCDAAAFYIAYNLGLPFFAFRPNSLEAATWSVANDRISLVDISKTLLWIMAPVAFESRKYPQMIVSDPREASSFLARLLKQVEDNDNDDIPTSDEEQQKLLNWAFIEAGRLLDENKNACRRLTERLVGGSATVGECVSVIEGW
eukprot:CAMPEP_0118714294 /NCGR_PEP_ID=MMETSP0800-20121206/26103_1 /TAXON_ID=210618 ORGANISM="Striatella unipunctata, Strain CCMP2910" /NCGR_SAMPLE_ID=MMETSP0800 /ASSEMBLY_ACC=CAM_ASM_000638 /LENGTH=462 /DNA_ID=CAMNT_0006620063 /DNA_START=445 /DNA_END=1833 /DNA_ORIENTATION=-